MIRWDLFQGSKNGSTPANQSMRYYQINQMKDKSHRIISVDPEKASDGSQLPFTIKTLNKVDTKGTYLNIIKAVDGKPIALWGLTLTFLLSPLLESVHRI